MQKSKIQNPKSKIEIVRAERSDARAIAEVLAASFEQFEELYTCEAFRATTPTSGEIKTRFETDNIWIARLAGEIVGTVSALPEDGAVYIRSMAVVPGARGEKIGKSFLLEIERYASENGFQKLVLDTTPFLTRAISLYENFGFRRRSGRGKDLFGTPLMTMEKDIGNTG